MTFPDGARGFRNPILGGQGALIRPVEKSKNYNPGVSGWAIFSNGNVEFNSGTFRGNIIVGSAGGNRIEINVASGVINMFNAANQRTGSWDSNSQWFVLYKAGTTTQYVMLTSGGNPRMLLNPNTAVYSIDASVEISTVAVDGGIGSLDLWSPAPLGRTQSLLSLYSEGVNGTVKPRVELNNHTFPATQTGEIRVDGAWNLITMNAGFQSAAALANGNDPAYRYVTPHRIECRGQWQPSPAGAIVTGSVWGTVPVAARPPNNNYYVGGTSLTATVVSGRTKIDNLGQFTFNFVGANAPTFSSIDGMGWDLI